MILRKHYAAAARRRLSGLVAKTGAAIALACALVVSQAAFADSAIAEKSTSAVKVYDELPLWEVAVGATAIRVPYYRGAKDSDTLALPFVYPVYRGDRFRIDNKGIRGELFSTERVSLDISGDAGVPGSSGDVFGRDGMPDLDPTFQLGPSMEIMLTKSDDKDSWVQLNLPLRGVFAVDSGISNIGYTFSPQVAMFHRFPMFNRRWRAGFSAGLEFGSQKYHDYYYEVAPEFATPSRSVYDAPSGYAGTRLSATLVSRTPKNFVTLFARYDSVDGARFEDSPLVFRSTGLTVGVAFAWFVARSKTLVPVEP